MDRGAIHDIGFSAPPLSTKLGFTLSKRARLPYNALATLSCELLVKRRVLIILVLLTGALFAQQWRRWGRRRTPDRSEYPTWKIEEHFDDDVFTFVRIQYDSPGTVIDGFWNNDYPDSDWNFSYRLQQLTSIKCDPNGRVLRLEDRDIFDYPFLYMLGTRDVVHSETGIANLREYLLNGGFLMVDDFWCDKEWDDLYEQMKRVFPNREPVELGIDHPIFNIVYEFKEKPMVPSIQAWREGWEFEYWHGQTRDEKPHFWGIMDDDGRMMALLCHNNDVGDAWQREGEETGYFHKYSEKLSYPLGINIITYVMTH